MYTVYTVLGQKNTCNKFETSKFAVGVMHDNKLKFEMVILWEVTGKIW